MRAPIQNVHGLKGTETFSMCSQNTEILFQTATLRRDCYSYLFMSTDGLKNSFISSYNYNIFLKDVINRIETHDFKTVSNIFPDWIASYSKNGSGDDISYLLVKFNHKLSVTNKIVNGLFNKQRLSI